MFQKSSSHRRSSNGRFHRILILIALILAQLVEIEGIKCYECNDTTIPPDWEEKLMNSRIAKWSSDFRCQELTRWIPYECSSVHNACFKVVIHGGGKDHLGKERDIVRRGCHTYNFDVSDNKSLTHWCKDELLSPPSTIGRSCFCTTDFCNSSPSPNLSNNPIVFTFLYYGFGAVYVLNNAFVLHLI